MTPRPTIPLAALSLAIVAACTPGSGAIRLEARSGRVIDRESRAPVADADVFQVYWGRGIAGEPRPAYSLRWVASDRTGSFAFDEQLSSEPRSWVLETDAAEYGFFHPDYGLVRSGPVRNGDRLTLEASRPDPERSRAEWLSLCGSRPPDEIVAEVARSHCATRRR